MRFGCGHMGPNTQLLQGLCSDGLWKFAVFWSLKSEKHGILTWGDGFVDKMTKDAQISNLYAYPSDSDNQITPSTWSNNGQYQSYPLCLIEAALLRMSSHSYSLGEEILGKVAVTGQHCWISANELCSTFMYKYPEDWQLQFAAGIKTVLLIPVVPHGVLHLGSLYMVLESSVLVAHIKDLFYKFYDPSVPHNSSDTGFGYLHTLRKPTANLSVNPPDVLAHDLSDLIQNSAQLWTIDHITLPQPLIMSEFPILEDVIIGPYDTGLIACPGETLDGSESYLLANVHEEPSGITHCNTMFKPDMTDLSCMDKFDPNNKLICRSVVNIEDSEYDDINGFTLTYMAQEYQEHTDGSTMVINDDVNSYSSVHSKLHKDLEAMSREEHEDFMRHSRLKQQKSTSHSLLGADGNKTDFYSHIENDDYAEFLLDAITDQVDNIPNSNSSHSTDSLVSCETQIQREDHALRLEESSVPDPAGGQELSPISINEGFMSSKMTVSSSTEINKTVTEECTGHTTQVVHRGSSVEIKKGCRKFELNRTRPRDRQLIQDRMKELRELVPNASKCSIDALLARAITHILFLQSISEKAEKLKNKIGNKESCDKAKQLKSCPLRVEELEQSGHLLIEMLCKEYEVFFETAHLFKGLKVGILKGELEYRSGELWACFVIEASQGSNQMHILCPLMHLLQRR